MNNQKISIERVYYKSPGVMWRFFGAFGASGVYGNLSSYGMYADDSTFQLVPAWQTKLQAQDFQTSMNTRASHYSYEIRNNQITEKYGFYFDRCVACGLLFCNPYPTDEQIHYYYNSDMKNFENDRLVFFFDFTCSSQALKISIYVN